MDSQPHHCSYTWYTGCNHKIKNCHPTWPMTGRMSNPGILGPCPDCREQAQRDDLARFAPAVG